MTKKYIVQAKYIVGPDRPQAMICVFKRERPPNGLGVCAAIILDLVCLTDFKAEVNRLHEQAQQLGLIPPSKGPAGRRRKGG